MELRILGKTDLGFKYNGIIFNNRSFNIFAGLNPIDSRENVAHAMQILAQYGLQCAHMGVYYLNNNPYGFQGVGSICLPHVLEMASKYKIKVLSIPINAEQQIDAIDAAIAKYKPDTKIMLQIGTINAQNFPLLRHIGLQNKYPVIIKRSLGVSLDDALQTAEYVAASGNTRVIFCLRGVKSIYTKEHKHLTDFAQIPVIKRLTKMPIAVYPSESVGNCNVGIDGILDIHHAAAQGVSAGANIMFVDFHPKKDATTINGMQALSSAQLGLFLQDMQISRQFYVKRTKLVTQQEYEFI